MAREPACVRTRGAAPPVAEVPALDAGTTNTVVAGLGRLCENSARRRAGRWTFYRQPVSTVMAGPAPAMTVETDRRWTIHLSFLRQVEISPSLGCGPPEAVH